MSKPIDKGPDPSPDCPRCNYFAHTQPARDERRMRPNPYPPLDQHKVERILAIAFPQKERKERK